VRAVVVEHEGAVGQVVEIGDVAALPSRLRVDSFAVELRVDVVGVQSVPQRAETFVVVATALGARAVPGRERRRLVEEEKLGVPARLHQRRAAPVSKLQPAGDPAPAVVSPPDAAALVVQTASVAVHEAARRIRDQLAQRRNAVLERHASYGTSLSMGRDAEEQTVIAVETAATWFKPGCVEGA